jgi:hypothetical protein
MIKNLTNKLVLHIETEKYLKVGSIILQIKFNTTWQPYIISCNNIVLDDVPTEFVLMRNESLFPFGIIFFYLIFYIEFFLLLFIFFYFKFIYIQLFYVFYF